MSTDPFAAPDPASPSPGAPVDAPVGADRYCIRCAYALVGLLPTNNCPECGTSIALSLRERTLANAAPEYLRALSGGLSLVLNGILLMIVVIVGGIVIGAVLPATHTASIVSSLAMLVVSAIIMVGYLKFTTPDPGQVAMEATNSARMIIRTVVPIQASLTAVQVGLVFITPVGNPYAGVSGLLSLLVTLIAFVLQGIQFFSVMRYTRWLATRVPDFFVVRRTKVYMWLLPVLYILGAILLFVGPIIALVMYWNLLDRMRKHVKSIIATGQPANLKQRLA